MSNELYLLRFQALLLSHRCHYSQWSNQRNDRRHDEAYQILLQGVLSCHRTEKLIKKKRKVYTHAVLIFNEKGLTSAMFCIFGAAIKTTYGVNSADRRIFKACGSTSSIAILPSA